MPRGLKTIKASQRATPVPHKKVKRSEKELKAFQEKYETCQKAAAPLMVRYAQAVDEKAALAEEVGEEDPAVASTKAACDFSGDVEGLKDMHNIVFNRNTPLTVADTTDEPYNTVHLQWGVLEDEFGNRDYKNAADAEADAVGSGHAQLENHTARGIVTCGKQMLKGLKCAQCRQAEACYLQSPAHIEAAAVATAKLRGEDANQVKQDDIDLLCRLATGDEEDKAILTQLRCVCNEPMCLLAAGIKDVDKCTEWHKKGEFPNMRGRNVRHDTVFDIQEGLHLARERFVEIPKDADADARREAEAQVIALVDETLDCSYQLRGWEVTCATTATVLAAHAKTVGISTPDASDFLARMQSAPRVLLRHWALEHVMTTDWDATGRRVVMGPGENRGKDWGKYLDSVILDRSSGFPNPWVLARVYLTIRNYEANNYPKDGAGKPVHRVRASQMCDYWLDQVAQSKHLSPIFADNAFKEALAYLSSACSAEHTNGANKTNAFADAKKANPLLKKHEIHQLVRAQIESAREDKSLASLIYKCKKGIEFCTHDHNSKDAAALYVDKQVRGAALGLGLLDIVEGEEGAMALLLTRGGTKAAPGCKRAYHFTPPDVVDDLDIVHPDAANPMPVPPIDMARVHLSQGGAAARKRTVGALQTRRQEPVTLSAVPRLDVHNGGGTKVSARERTGDCPKAALRLVQQIIPLDPDTKKALLVTSATPAADTPGRTWTSKLQMGMKDVSEEDKEKYSAILAASLDLAKFKENGTRPSKLSEEDMAQKLASARVLVDACDQKGKLRYLTEPLGDLPSILANHPKELEPALRKLAAFHKKASPRRKSPVPVDLGVASSQGVQKPNRRMSEAHQAHLDEEAARQDQIHSKSHDRLKTMKARNKKRHTATQRARGTFKRCAMALAREVSALNLGALHKASNRKAAEAVAATEEAAAEAVSGDAEVSYSDLFDPEE